MAINISNSTVTSIYSSLEKVMQGFVTRKAQREMTDLIVNGLDGDAFRTRILAIEAPTGVGKTMAYLVGCVAEALLHKKTVVISTATVNLQSQLINHDLPILAAAVEDALDRPLKFALAKGRLRYVCVSRLESAYSSQRELLDLQPNVIDFAGMNSIIANMYRSFVNDEWDGDHDHWNTRIPVSLWTVISTDKKGCYLKKCQHYFVCPFYKMRDSLDDANVIVANHDVVLKDAAFGGGVLLPEMKTLIYVFDEVHGLAPKALSHAAQKVDFTLVTEECKKAPDILNRLPTLLRYSHNDVTRRVEIVKDELKNVMERLEFLTSYLWTIPQQKMDNVNTTVEMLTPWGERDFNKMQPAALELGASCARIKKQLEHFLDLLKEAREYRKSSIEVLDRFLNIVSTMLDIYTQVKMCVQTFFSESAETVDGVMVRWVAFTPIHSTEFDLSV